MDRQILLENKIITKKGMINPHFTRKLLAGHKEAMDWNAKVISVTSFLPPDAHLKERIFCILNNIQNRPKCKECSSSTKLQYHHDIKAFRFSTFCSQHCSLKHRDEVEILKKRKQTNLKRFGAESPMHVSEVRAKLEETWNKKFNGRHPNQAHISDETWNILNSETELKRMHHDEKLSINAMSYLLKIDGTVISKALKKFNISRKNYTRSLGELQISQFLDLLGVTYETNNRECIGRELDIFIPDHNLAIEYCGLYWHADFQTHIHPRSHKLKYDLCKDKGIQLLTIFEDEWFLSADIVKTKIQHLLKIKNEPSIYARNTSICTINKTERKEFFNKFHIQGDGPGSINIGLLYENQLVACMAFIKQQNNVFVLNRYATSTNVVGGFTKLLKYFQQNYQWSKIVSFADLRWSNGELYEKAGWTMDKILPPDYCYVNTTKQTRIHKFNYRRKYLPDLLKTFDPQKSERENCDINRIPRLWDCGKHRYILTNE